MINSSRWVKLNFAQQLGNIASELARARYWESKNDSVTCTKSLERVLELVELTLSDDRWRKRRKELARLNEVLCDRFSGQKFYQVSLDEIGKYCITFALHDK